MLEEKANQMGVCFSSVKAKRLERCVLCYFRPVAVAGCQGQAEAFSCGQQQSSEIRASGAGS